MINVEEDNTDDVSIAGIENLRMSSDHLNPEPKTLIALEIDFDRQFDVRCKMRGRFDLGDYSDNLATCLADVIGGSDGEIPLDIAATRKWTAPRHTMPRAGHGITRLSLNSSELCYVAVLLADGLDRLQFSSTHAPFTAKSVPAQKRLSRPRNVVVQGDGALTIYGAHREAPALNPFNPAETRRARLALFAADMTGLPAGSHILAFNILLESVGRVRTAPGEWTLYRTPIIIDPDLRHPPEEGGIPTHP